MRTSGTVSGLLRAMPSIAVAAGVAVFLWTDDRVTACILFVSGWLVLIALRGPSAWWRPQCSDSTKQSPECRDVLRPAATPTAKPPLEEADEALAGALASLSRNPAQMVGYDARFADIAPMLKVEEIGAELNGRGGHELMKRVCCRAQLLGGNRHVISWLWDGIGEWHHKDCC